MRKLNFAFVLVALIAIVSWGCNGASDSGTGDSNATSAAHDHDREHGDDHDHGETVTLQTAAIICGDCGEAKGSEACCADGEKCEECKMIKGSALCCVELAADAAGKDICGQCGHVADANHQCDENCEKCADCGLHKGSPACCKLKS